MQANVEKPPAPAHSRRGWRAVVRGGLGDSGGFGDLFQCRVGVLAQHWFRGVEDGAHGASGVGSQRERSGSAAGAQRAGGCGAAWADLLASAHLMPRRPRTLVARIAELVTRGVADAANQGAARAAV
ncbi:hypothetical protein [Nocardia sp. NPDC005998]|uniref:hypothetical protein n=1 Tax=Nocardia sp. NPDC005998 TaxID=3156894 RepID=UPI0033AC0CF1